MYTLIIYILLYYSLTSDGRRIARWTSSPWGHLLKRVYDWVCVYIYIYTYVYIYIYMYIYIYIELL